MAFILQFPLYRDFQFCTSQVHQQRGDKYRIYKRRSFYQLVLLLLHIFLENKNNRKLQQSDYSEGTRTCYFQKVKKIKVTPVNKGTIDPDRYRLYEVYSVGPIQIGVVDHLRARNQGSRHSPF